MKANNPATIQNPNNRTDNEDWDKKKIERDKNPNSSENSNAQGEVEISKPETRVFSNKDALLNTLMKVKLLK